MYIPANYKFYPTINLYVKFHFPQSVLTLKQTGRNRVVRIAARYGLDGSAIQSR